MHAPLPPAFRQLSSANLLAQLAEQLSLAAVPIVAVLVLQAGPAEIGLLASVQSLPFLLMAIPMGLLADRTARRRLMLWSELLRAAALALLVGMLLAGQVSLALLATTGFLAAGLLWALTLGAGGRAVATFFLLCVVVAGAYGAYSVSRRILYVQALPALLGLVLLHWA